MPRSGRVQREQNGPPFWLDAGRVGREVAGGREVAPSERSE